ncbi:phosphatase PAP2 family protein [Phenylobacterium sp.]|uniref:phosphatase PAP2 family protein n=1 Tax=Phenylobacterium sp. TaxID=1871053 RepID=UPI002D120C25|nr:phosphatase PAP2 family protein [Phenylobacterium sp.]HLZ76747.1 phosphatase PAP2 family protein [Phenylobacterium sp.]
MAKVLKHLLKRLESRVLIVLIAAAGALWGFFNIASEVGEGETKALDTRLLLMLRNAAEPSDPVGSQALQESMRDVTALGGVTVITLVTTVALLLFLMHRKLWHAGIFALAVTLAFVSSEGLKDVYDRPRPELAPHGSYVYGSSFPSGHSTLSAAVYLTLAVLISSLEANRGTKRMVFALAGVLVAGIGFSRVYLAVHWPSDVLAGWCLGGAWALIAWVALLRFGGRDQIAEPEPAAEASHPQ